jgi:hypothetical protein
MVAFGNKILEKVMAWHYGYYFSMTQDIMHVLALLTEKNVVRGVKGLLGLSPLGLISRLLRGPSKTSLCNERRCINL